MYGWRAWLPMTEMAYLELDDVLATALRLRDRMKLLCFTDCGWVVSSYSTVSRGRQGWCGPH